MGKQSPEEAGPPSAVGLRSQLDGWTEQED